MPATFDWHDIGDFATLAELSTADADGVVRIGCDGEVRVVAADGVVAIGAARTLAVVGVSDVIVVETADAVLVVSKAAAQDVKDAATAPSAARL